MKRYRMIHTYTGQILRKSTALLLCGALAAASAGCSQTQGSGSSSSAASSEDVDKAETVYVKAAADGSTQEITVQTDLKNDSSSDQIADYSELTDIKNTEGSEEFIQESDGSILWENNGEDIHYEGTSDAELPVTVSITYYLDGTEISAEELAGKSGSLRIRFDYTNHTSQTVSVNGKNEETPVPFAVLSAVLLSEETASDVAVTNGKILSMNGQTVILGYACPGLTESLGLSGYELTEDISVPEYVEVTADVTDFELLPCFRRTITAERTGNRRQCTCTDNRRRNNRHGVSGSERIVCSCLCIFR